MRDLFAFIENESKEKICHLFTDNGTEFKNRSLQSYYASKGIDHLTPRTIPLPKGETGQPLKKLNVSSKIPNWGLVSGPKQ
jgi:hypothetical protein